MKSWKFIFFCQCITIALIPVVAKDCVWDRETEFGKFPPFFLYLGEWKSILPTTEGTKSVTRIAEGKNVLVSCPGNKNIATDEETVIAKCNGRNKLRIGKKSYTVKSLSCLQRVKESLSDTPRPCRICAANCFNDYYSIGYNMTNFGFYDLIQFRFNHSSDTTLWTVHLLRGESVEASDRNPSRPSFKTDRDFFVKSPNTAYQQSHQKTKMTSIFGNSNYINVSKSLYFARGHLSPDADFLTEMEADATYWYLNAAPQWQAFNNGNWKYLEMATRKLAELRKTDFHIWTGTYGVLELQDANGEKQKIFLGNEIIPVPEITWKLLYEPSTNQGIAVFGCNNPYLENFPETLCPDICDQISWIEFDTKDLSKGATYCCSVKEFLKIFPGLGIEAFARADLLKGVESTL